MINPKMINFQRHLILIFDPLTLRTKINGLKFDSVTVICVDIMLYIRFVFFSSSDLGI